MFSGYYKPLDNIASVIPCSPEMSIRTTIADGLMVARVKPGNKQHPGYDTRRESNGKITSICLCCHGYNIWSLTKPFNDIA